MTPLPIRCASGNPFRKRFLGLRLVLLVCLAGSGCHFAQLPDPNDPRNVAPDAVAPLLRKTIQSTADRLNDRVLSGQITDQLRVKLISEKANELLTYGDPKTCQPQDAWIYADLLMTAGKFSEAIPILQKAIQYAKASHNDDRRVNDSLRLAKALAKTGQVKASLDLVQSVIDSKPSDPGPVLPSVLLEIDPIARKKGYDDQLARILEESIHEHLRMKVDPSSVEGKSFLVARPYHIGKAWREIVMLLQQSGHADAATAARARGEKMLREIAPPTI